MRVAGAAEIRSGGRNQDRAEYFYRLDKVFLALATGASGLGNGGKAAERVLTEAASAAALGQLFQFRWRACCTRSRCSNVVFLTY